MKDLGRVRTISFTIVSILLLWTVLMKGTYAECLLIMDSGFNPSSLDCTYESAPAAVAGSLPVGFQSFFSGLYL